MATMPSLHYRDHKNLIIRLAATCVRMRMICSTLQTRESSRQHVSYGAVCISTQEEKEIAVDEREKDKGDDNTSYSVVEFEQ